MTTQPEALRLASESFWDDKECQEAAAELRRLYQSEREGWRYADELEQERKRLHEVNQMLVGALKQMLDEPNNTMSDGKALKEIIRIARGALAKAKRSDK